MQRFFYFVIPGRGTSWVMLMHTWNNLQVSPGWSGAVFTAVFFVL